MHWWSIRLLCGGILVDTGGSQGGRPINLGPVYANSLQSDFLKWWGLEEEFYFLEFQRTSGNKSLDVVSKFGTESQDWILFLSRDIWRKNLLSFRDFVKHRTHSFWRLLLVFRQHQSILGIPRICWSASNFTLWENTLWNNLKAAVHSFQKIYPVAWSPTICKRSETQTQWKSESDNNQTSYRDWF